MILLSTVFNDRGEPLATRQVELNDVRCSELQILHLRLGLEITLITQSGRVDYRLLGAAQHPTGYGVRS